MNMEFNPWTTPNFMTIKMPPRPRQEGFQEGPKLALSEVDAETLSYQCDRFREEIFNKAGKTDPVKTKEN